MKPFFKLFTWSIIVLASFLIGKVNVQAQGKVHIVQFSGLVLSGDDGQPVVGATLYIPKAGRGGVTNEYGAFSMPTLVGDSIVITAIGFKKRFYKIPNTTDEGHSVVIELKTDTTTLPIVEVYPYPTEELFKKAILALDLPDEDQQKQLAKNFDPVALAKMTQTLGASSEMNYRYITQQQLNYTTNRYFSPTWTFLDPFRWAQFIKSLKKNKNNNKKK
ncbi:carboxypeptidase-like regulatory domain-containing protein [Xanthocytophaga agilis]|uniref:Carboxypeptidase-like regulatory domain-containing protein n=1 Tax=Xanthocytophaga agilis TaxID=3048010 RepID=A0AAE3R8W1_9BACT|nr:carboxypeptidase-like regulatory domain-containing protein [Xanthocytophaga agilis]MDJ1502883.1 carboxypeptidase-like regulatory domain-containing protein [Xanthocytophaga agilis]